MSTDKVWTWKEAAEAGHIACVIDGHHGVYVPQAYTQQYPDHIKSDDDRRILLSGPDHEYYWDVWDEVLSGSEFTDSDGSKWNLYQDGDLFAIRADIELDPDSFPF